MVPESVLVKTERPSFFLLLRFPPVTGIHHLIYQLLSRSWICWSWASLTLGPLNVESVHVPTWQMQEPAGHAHCSLHQGEPRARLLLSQLPGPSTPARNLWTFAELASYAKHLCSWAGDPRATFQLSLWDGAPIFHFQPSFDIFACSGLASCNWKKQVLLGSTFSSIHSSVHLPNQKALIKNSPVKFWIFQHSVPHNGIGTHAGNFDV